MHGHFLAECVDSILGQTCADFEVLIMDDCSPDDTPAVARSITDPRVRYVRNARNLGHLANYNKGIELARGEYIWLINVDDYLRRPYVLEQFVAVMDRTPSAAFVCCPAVVVRDGVEEPPHGVHGPIDRIFRGSDFVRRLLVINCVATPAVMVRRRSYESVGVFPLDMPHAGDWFQWCRHALHGDVAYLAEPMVCYRLHDSNMSSYYHANPAKLAADELKVRWRVKHLAARSHPGAVARAALHEIVRHYERRVTGRITESCRDGMTFEEFETSLREHSQDPRDVAHVRARVLTAMGDTYYTRGTFHLARQHYRRALRHAPLTPSVWAKWALLVSGGGGRSLRLLANRLRRAPRRGTMQAS
jgi:glycosyltransferase involved in cell wall biosynthesis